MTTLLSHYGSDHLYNVDPYNEMLPSSRDPSYLRRYFAQNQCLGVKNFVIVFAISLSYPDHDNNLS